MAKSSRCDECHFDPCRCEDLASGQAFGMANTPSCWPQRSLALSVHSRQVEKARERAKRHNLGVEYLNDGTAIIADRAERKRLLKLEGMHDNEGSYGD